MSDTKISALTSKGSPVGADIIPILDSAASNANKRTTLAALPIPTAVQTAITAITPRQAAYQAVAYASTITIDPTAGAVVQVGALTGNLTIAAPTSPQNGDTLCICLKQDATGGRTVAWNAAFATDSVPALNTAANARTQATFVYADSIWQ